MFRYIRFLSYILCSVYVCSCAGFGTGRGSEYVKKPYIQSCTHTSAVIMWETAGKQPAVLKIGKKVVRVEEEKRVHEIKVDGLSPQTSYAYKVNGKKAGAFTTFPSPGDYPFKIAICGDAGTFSSKAAALIRKEKPLFVIHTGHTAEGKGEAEQWNRGFFSPLQNVMNRICLFTVPGACTRFSPLFAQFFSFPGQEQYYSLNAGSAHIVFLDSNAEGDRFREQLEWLSKDLKNDTHTWKFAVFHHTPFSGGRGAITGRILDAFLPLFYEHGVQLMFHGRDSGYIRIGPVIDEKGRVIISINAGGGSGSGPAAAGKNTATGSKIADSLCLLTVTPDALTGKAVDMNGRSVDTFEYKKSSIKEYAERGISLHSLMSEYFLKSGISALAKIKGPVAPNSIMECSVAVPPFYLNGVGCSVSWNRKKTTWHVKPEMKKAVLQPAGETVFSFLLDYWGSAYPAVKPEIKLTYKKKEYPMKADLILPGFRETTITEMQGIPDIDGNITGQEIAGLKRVSGFIRADANTEAERQTAFYCGVFGTSIYMGLMNMEPDMGKLTVKAEKKDQNVRADDCDLLFFKIPGKEHCYTLAVSAAGIVYDARDGNAEWDENWKAAVKRFDNRWDAEILFPIKILGKDLGPGEDLTVKMNICRNNTVNGEYSQWSRTYGPDCRIEYFGTGIILRK